jgi:hypothetical protein
MPSSAFVLIGAAAFTTIYLILFLIYILDMAGMLNIELMDARDLKGVAWLIIVGYLFFPLPIFNYHGRFYFAKLFFFMITSPVTGADFKLHWLAEQFASFKQPLQDITYTISFYFLDRSSSYENALLFGIWIAVYVYVLRILQGIRMGMSNGAYFDTPLFRGAWKCVFNINTIIMAYLYRLNRN